MKGEETVTCTFDLTASLALLITVRVKVVFAVSVPVAVPIPLVAFEVISEDPAPLVPISALLPAVKTGVSVVD